MYEAYWGLDEKPFENTPDPRFLFQSDGASTVYRLALYALENNRGAVMLTGESGCGKTLMARSLVQELDPDKTEVALLTNPRWSPEEFMLEILYQLGHEEELQGRTKIVHRLHEVLYENFEAGKSTLVLIDEGQLIQEQTVLEEIRLLLNYQLNDAFLVSLLLVGQSAMAQQIRDFAPLDQRIVTRGSLKSFGVEEAGQYVAHRLKVAGRSEPVFTADAIEQVTEYAQGIPRKINNICDIALVVGFSRKLAEIDADWVRRLIRAEGSHGA